MRDRRASMSEEPRGRAARSRRSLEQSLETLWSRTGHMQVEQEQLGVGVLLDQAQQRIHAVGAVYVGVRDGRDDGALQRVAEQRVIVGDQYIGHIYSALSVGAHPVRDRGIATYGFVGLSRTGCAPTGGSVT